MSPRLICQGQEVAITARKPVIVNTWILPTQGWDWSGVGHYVTDKGCAGKRTSGRDPRLIRSPNEPNGRDLKFQLSCFYQTQPTTPQPPGTFISIIIIIIILQPHRTLQMAGIRCVCWCTRLTRGRWQTAALLSHFSSSNRCQNHKDN